MTYYVITGTKAEYDLYLHKVIQKRWQAGDKSANPQDYNRVISKANLVGVKNPHGVFFGTWRQRHDINDILVELMTRSDNLEVLHKIQEELNKKPEIMVSVNGIVQTPADYTVSEVAVTFNKPITLGNTVSIVNVKTSRVYVAIAQTQNQNYFIPS